MTAYREASTDGVDSAIRSIRVASTLVDRFRALLASGPNADADLVAGEAQRLYPEMWRHLDDAARVLRKRARNLDEFDYLRKQELGALGITDVDVSLELDLVSLAFGRLHATQVKTITFNVAGYDRARAACSVLMRALPEVDWAALARAEDKEIAAAGSLHTAKGLAALKYVAIVAGLIAATILIYTLFDRVKPEPPASSPSGNKELTPQEITARNERVAREIEIDELTAKYHATCSPSVRGRIVYLLNENKRSALAHTLETERCKPTPPECTEAKHHAFNVYIAANHPSAGKHTNVICHALSLANGGGLFTPVYLLLVNGMRTVVTETVDIELIPLVKSPGELLDTADLDGDGADELVFIGASLVVVTRIADLSFRDLPGPPLGNCRASIDIRLQSPDKHKALMLDCPKVGRRWYRLSADQLVDDP